MRRIALFALGLAGFHPLLAAAGPVAAAREALQQIVREENAWTKVHAAEVLLAAGETRLVAEVFRREHELHGQEKNYRVGIWRVLAQACPAERTRWWGKVAVDFLDPAAPDRLFALESLAKLGDPLTPEVAAAVHTWAASAPVTERAFADWLDGQRGDGTAVARLVEGLRSTEVLARYRSAYALRRLQCTDPVALAALQSAALTEPADSIGRPAVIGAAYALAADPGQMDLWAATLEEMVRQGAPAAYEALQALPARYTEADLPRLFSLLRHPQADVRTGAAGAIFTIAGLIPKNSATTVADRNPYAAKPTRPDACRQRLEAFQGRPCDLIFIGDSITEGWAGRGRDVWKEFYAARRALNFGVSGDRTQDVLWRLENFPMAGLRPKVGVIMIGTNNGSNTVAEIAGGVRAVVIRTRQLFPGIKIILVSILPGRRAGDINARMMAVDALLQHWADGDDLVYLDLTKDFVPAGDSWLGLGPDGIHPAAKGYEIWAKAMAPLLDHLLGPDESPRPPVTRS